MADTKISELTAVVTPASTDEFAVNQSGTSKKITRAQVLELESAEQIKMPSDNDATTPNIAFGANENTGFFSGGNNQINVATGGTERWEINASDMRSATSGGFFLDYTATSGTNPAYAFSGDATTGVGRQAGGNVSLIGSGAEALRAENPAALAAGETSLWLYDDDNGAMQQVTVGAADSGGAGFKVLRIPN